MELDVAGNDVLRVVDVSEGNRLSSEAWDRLFCSLGDRIGLTVGCVYAMDLWEEEMDGELRMANDENAEARNWEVRQGWRVLELEGTRGCEF